MPKELLALGEGVKHRKAVWLTAALILLVTIGAACFGWRGKRGSQVEEPPADAAARATTVGLGEAAAMPRTAARGETGAGRTIPKSPVAQPFEFLSELAQAAFDGDGEAQYRVAKELDRCELTLSLVRKSSDPEAEIWNLPAGWTQSMKERAFAEYKRCSRLMREDPFAKLPRRPGGYNYEYWMARAAESGQPLAVVEKTLSTLTMQPDDSANVDEAARAEARKKLANAMMSGNPDALLLFGFRMRNSTDTERKLKGAAWMLAGCQAGADCGFDSAIVPIWMCYDSGDTECQPGMDVQDVLSKSLAPADFAEAYARSGRIAAGIRAGDVDAINAELGY